MNSKIWLSSPHMGGTERKFVTEAFDSNWIAPLGPNLNGFEQDLESYLLEDRFVACVVSGTAAIHLALRLAGVSVGDEVLCQSFTFVATANPIIYQGAIPIFIDSELDTWNMCTAALEEAIIDRISKGNKPKAILVVHLYGIPAKIIEIAAIAKKYDITLIEDAAEALGSSFKGQKCGTFGDFSTLSFNGNKIITTSSGGALICREKYVKERAIYLATQAKIEGSVHGEVGFNYRMSNVVAAIGKGQMKVLDKRVEQRRKAKQDEDER